MHPEPVFAYPTDLPHSADPLSVEFFTWRYGVMSEEKKQWAIALLREKAAELNRPPKKDDFDEATRARIKAFLGPWPRALEAAGLKPPRKPR